MDDGSLDGMRRLQKGDVILGRYAVEGELGQGGMGVVYLCLDRVGGVRVAVKALPPEVSHDSGEMEEVRDNFQLVVGLRHSCIAGVRTLEKDAGGEYFLVMDVAEGEPLRKWIRAKWKAGGLQLAEAVAVLRQVASALDYAHGQKVIHRDVKPGNVMIDSEGRAKVLDFGLAAQIRTSLSRTSRVVRGTSGTGPYMSPEQWEAQPQDARADQYALGVMAYEMLAGHLPFENPEISVLREAVLKGTVRDIPGLAPKAMAAIRRAMAKNPGERFPTCEAFVDALEGKRVAGNPRTAKGLLAGAAALAAVAVLAVVAGRLQSKTPTADTPRITGLIGLDITNDVPVVKPKDDPPHPPPPTDPVEQALQAFRDKDYEKGFRLASKDGKSHPKLQFYLGVCYDEQEPQARVSRAGKSDWTAKQWYDRAAAQGDVLAMMKLGLFAENGRAGEIDLETAQQWYQRAADAGSTVGAGHLARLKALVEQNAEDELLEEKRKQGYTVVGPRGARKAVWPGAGVPLTAYPHWITEKAEKTWRAEDGYEKANPNGLPLSELRWKAGVFKKGDSNCKSGTQEGTWLRKVECPACGRKGQVPDSVPCSACSGTGRITVEKTCTRCGGSGEMVEKARCQDCDGRRTMSQRCPACRGNGFVTCSTCKGSGQEMNPLAGMADIVNLFSDKKVNAGSRYITCTACGGAKTLACARCGGTGAIQNPCTTCRGTGERSWTVDCPNCQGRGKTISSEPCGACNNGRQMKLNRCAQCNGNGFVWRQE